MRFFKYHALGNDFVILDRFHGGDRLDAVTAAAWCDRHRGIGADGVLTVERASDGHPQMVIQNADGSEAGMCGNGLRCMARYLFEAGHATQAEGALYVGAVRYPYSRLAINRYRVHMGSPVDQASHLPPGGNAPGLASDETQLDVDGTPWVGTRVSFGNPHWVHFTDENPRSLAERWGPALSEHPLFPDRANISWVRVEADRLVTVVHERGVGITEACGSGACAVGVAAVRRGLRDAGQAMAVVLPGGTLTIQVDRVGVTMEGEAHRVFAGQMP